MTEPANVLLVGSVPLESAREVFQSCATALGPYLRALPDGEVGKRKSWIQCQAIFVFDNHPALETIARPRSPDGLPREYGDNWVFRVKPGIDAIVFDDLKYAEWAAESYQTFLDLRQHGEIPAGLRFQVCLPTPLGGSVGFFDEPRDRELVYSGYTTAMMREVEKLCRMIPPDDLALQWDVCLEVLEIAANTQFLPDDPWTRAGAQFERIAQSIPFSTRLGYHFCYGDLAHRHMVEPTDLALSVRMANLAFTRSSRRVDWVHMPVPISRDDEAYFAPLADLRNGDAEVFLGLIHLHDGVEGSLQRARTAKHYLSGFGIATECGLGRRDPKTLAELLRIHREVAVQLPSLTP